ncbi:hypothetical protein [Pelagicoccus sp. SDUM812002]|uniref:hypothetical protein n=1 Tax=Pelagicoccus sp. SDUM812002 TaxID=3041266 RepID=UPI00280D3856|nr:hypothetical protein [Pelagicoccus sp. SDUM812002]MDQ8188287.1 hypothetical protein [Pelagicoccus sp. SDUM812002]
MSPRTRSSEIAYWLGERTASASDSRAILFDIERSVTSITNAASFILTPTWMVFESRFQMGKYWSWVSGWSPNRNSVSISCIRAKERGFVSAVKKSPAI